MDNNNNTDWHSLFIATYNDFSAALLVLMPKLITAIAIFIIGFIVAHLIRILVRRLIISAMKLIRKSGLFLDDQQSLLKHPEQLISRLIFWFVLIFFVVTAARSLGFDVFSQWLSGLLAYLPVLVTATLILVAGIALSSMTKALVIRASILTEFGHHEFISRFIQVVIIATTVVITIEHLGVDVSFFTTAMIVLLGVIAFGFSLAFGLGAKNLIANITGAQACRHHFQEGDELVVGDYRGHVIEVGQSYLIIESATGRHIIPAKVLHDSPVTIVTPEIDK